MKIRIYKNKKQNLKGRFKIKKKPSISFSQTFHENSSETFISSELSSYVTVFSSTIIELEAYSEPCLASKVDRFFRK